jgi:ArsR family transcriptional regulator
MRAMPTAAQRRSAAKSAGARRAAPVRPQPKSVRPFAALFRALGDETRLEMVRQLAAQGKELCVCEIEAHFDLGQPTVSHHLRILRQAGIVTAERRGTWVYYALERGVLAQLRAFAAQLER